MAQLHGSCACDRNVYTIHIPTSLHTHAHAQVFFDNSLSSRRSQAVPVTAWLRVPLDWYQSSTVALFADESHSSIKRSFNVSTEGGGRANLRRQFCGYCGTHLTAWSEAEGEWLDVTLGSLEGGSVEVLRELGILLDDEEEEESEGGLVRGGEVQDESHIPTNGDQGETLPDESTRIITSKSSSATITQRMQNRGIPYFEEMVENSRLGRIKHQKGGHTSLDGRTTVEWEVVEIDNTEPTLPAPAAGGERVKRLKMDV